MISSAKFVFVFWDVEGGDPSQYPISSTDNILQMCDELKSEYEVISQKNVVRHVVQKMVDNHLIINDFTFSWMQKIIDGKIVLGDWIELGYSQEFPSVHFYAVLVDI